MWDAVRRGGVWGSALACDKVKSGEETITAACHPVCVRMMEICRAQDLCRCWFQTKDAEAQGNITENLAELHVSVWATDSHAVFQ